MDFLGIVSTWIAHGCLPYQKVQYQMDRKGMMISRRVEPLLNMIVYQFICIDLLKKQKKLLFGSLSKNVVILMLLFLLKHISAPKTMARSPVLASGICLF